MIKSNPARPTSAHQDVSSATRTIMSAPSATKITYRAACPRFTQPGRQGPLADLRIANDVAQIVGYQDRAGQSARRHTPVRSAAIRTRPICTYAVPQTATSPKKTKTKSSPRPR